MTFDCSEYFTLSLLHEYFDCKFKLVGTIKFLEQSCPPWAHWPVQRSQMRCRKREIRVASHLTSSTSSDRGRVAFFDAFTIFGWTKVHSAVVAGFDRIVF